MGIALSNEEIEAHRIEEMEQVGVGNAANRANQLEGFFQVARLPARI
jgi:hypothetical protein